MIIYIALRDISLDHDSLDLIEADLILPTVIELRGLGRGVCRHGARRLQLAAIGEIGGDPGRAEAVAIDWAGKPGCPCPPFDHMKRVPSGQPPPAERPPLLSRQRAKQRPLGGGKTASFQIRVKSSLERVVRRHVMALAALFMQAQPEPPPLAVDILDIHRKRRPDAGEAEQENPNQRPVAQPGDGFIRNAVQQMPGF